MSSFRAGACASAGRPVSAHSGRKEFIKAMDCAEHGSGGRSPFRGHGSALIRKTQNTNNAAARASVGWLLNLQIGRLVDWQIK